jgi:hypothetical protein
MLLDYDVDFMQNATWPVEKCSQGWEYNQTDVKSSIVIDVSNFKI